MTDTTVSALDGEYEPSPSQRVREQVRGYEASDGAEGGHWKVSPSSS